MYKNDEELSKMTADERNQYAVNKRTYEKELMEKTIKETVEGLETLTVKQKEEVKAFVLEQSKGKEGISKAEFDEIKEQLAEIKEKSEGTTTKIGTDIFGLIEKGLEEFLPKVIAQKSKLGDSENPWELEMTVKAPVTMTTGAITQPVATPVNYVYQNMNGQYASNVRQIEYIINYLSNGTTNKASLPYMDKLPTEGTMAITAEGALKPLISISFVLRYSQAEKIAGRAKISEEALDDIPQIMSIIRNELMYEHEIAEQLAIFAKVAAIAPAFVAGSLAATTTAPSNYDAIRAAIYAVKIASKGKYLPNAVVVPSADVYTMGATKDADRNYVLPAFVLPDGTRISGVQVIEDANGGTYLPDGSFIVGDWKRLHRDVYKSFTVRIGQGIQMNAVAANIISDFESNMYTLIGESRQHLWIYENEKVAFIKSTFAAVKTAIAAA